MSSSGLWRLMSLKATGPVCHGFRGCSRSLRRRRRVPRGALKLIDQGLAIAAETGEQFTDPIPPSPARRNPAERDPANPAPAEDALLTAIAISKQQATRSFELRAALSLAKLYQSTARPVDADGILSPALEGFTPTTEMPEFADAQALLARRCRKPTRSNRKSRSGSD